MNSKYPVPVRSEGRICFGIAYFLTESDAMKYADGVTSRNETYNGGLLHGCPCGREPGRDYIDEKLGKLFAVTER